MSLLFLISQASALVLFERKLLRQIGRNVLQKILESCADGLFSDKDLYGFPSSFLLIVQMIFDKLEICLKLYAHVAYSKHAMLVGFNEQHKRC